MSLITERPFSAVDEDNWGVPVVPAIYNFLIVSDPAAPRSGQSVAAIRYPAGFGGGDSPAFTERSLANTAGTLYVSMWIKYSSNWVGHVTGTNKILHFWVAGTNKIFAMAEGGGSAPLTPQIGLQGIAAPYDDGHGHVATGVNLQPNLPGQTGAQLVRGQWYRWEMVFTINTGGGANGTADWWINGVQVAHYTGITYVGSGQSRVFDRMRWDPTWGGLTGTVPADQYLYMDHIYMSGKP